MKPYEGFLSQESRQELNATFPAINFLNLAMLLSRFHATGNPPIENPELHV